MNKADLISNIVKETKLSKVQAASTLDAVLKSVSSTLKKGEDVRLIGFGTFSVKKRAARIGRNPQTGAEIKIPASTVPVFKPGKELKETVNTKKK